MNYHGTIHADRVYTEDQLMSILDISQVQVIEYYKAGLTYFQATRKQKRQIAGSAYHRFIERMSKSWPDDETTE